MSATATGTMERMEDAEVEKFMRALSIEERTRGTRRSLGPRVAARVAAFDAMDHNRRTEHVESE